MLRSDNAGKGQVSYLNMCVCTNIDRVDMVIQKRRLQWLGHVERMHGARLPKKLLVSKIRDGKHQEGQKQRWHDLIHADLKEVNMVVNWRTEAR